MTGESIGLVLPDGRPFDRGLQGHTGVMAFATDPATHAYYEARAAEYDDWWTGTGRFVDRERPGWAQELERLVALVGALPPARTLDVACGTAFLGRHLRGLVVGLDQSSSSVAIAQSRLPDGVALVGDALSLPFAAGSFQRVFTGHFYGHLSPTERVRFLAEARRVAPELIVVDTARRPDIESERWETRVLDDGSEHRVFKRYLTGAQLVEELGPRTEVLLEGSWFVAAASSDPLG